MKAIKGLCPIRNFGVLIENHLYRGAQPLYSYEFEWLKERGVKNLINLRSERDIDDKYHSMFDSVTDINVADHGVPTSEELSKFVETVRDKDNIFFHCEHGHGRTSTFAVIIRINMGWSLKKALHEEKVKFGYLFQHTDQIKFLENYEKIANGNNNSMVDNRSNELFPDNSSVPI